ncbi:poly(3-hydroxybutyrate) depolymerase [Pseudarthrobacter siccitolerans]|uniref:Poly(3-hydroxybutyrate) depolymerase n=1 Tax=Pseudarthrobacter siccitolerans TaxID=861266 RepID=A0ABU0PPH0_9MICC|nr:alpha/beta hydrolase-fold protein [Pseudarthrobacter siccitolerans]MDQ0675126.1 poly(3-hydroxybutyrate) depolymerase [Pseudarthrobacter siccitolerans]
MDFLLEYNLVDGVLMWTLTVLTAWLLVVLSWRRVPLWWLAAAWIFTGGALLAWLTLWVFEFVLDVVSNLPWQVRAWFTSFVGASVLTGVTFWKSPRWKKVLAVGAVPIFVVTTVVGINSYYGLRPTVAALLGISLAPQLDINKPAQDMTTSMPVLWRDWEAPPNMPATGVTRTQVIPGTLSGFTPRPAGVYLPPVALVDSPPALPLVVMMMGQPGDPDPRFAADALNELAARNRGLAPIVIVVDQLGNPLVDDLCLDTARFGNVETYINKDVVEWARRNLNVIGDARYWTAGGYSHGGQCAISFAAKYPETWGNVLDVSGEEYPGAEHPGSTLREIFHGDQTAYDAQKPEHILNIRQYKGIHAVFTACRDDPAYMTAARKISTAASHAGMTVNLLEIPEGGHGIGALATGLRDGFGILYPRLGLSNPTDGPAP